MWHRRLEQGYIERQCVLNVGLKRKCNVQCKWSYRSLTITLVRWVSAISIWVSSVCLFPKKKLAIKTVLLAVSTISLWRMSIQWISTEVNVEWQYDNDFIPPSFSRMWASNVRLGKYEHTSGIQSKLVHIIKAFQWTNLKPHPLDEDSPSVTNTSSHTYTWEDRFKSSIFPPKKSFDLLETLTKSLMLMQLTK